MISINLETLVYIKNISIQYANYINFYLMRISLTEQEPLVVFFALTLFPRMVSTAGLQNFYTCLVQIALSSQIGTVPLATVLTKGYF